MPMYPVTIKSLAGTTQYPLNNLIRHGFNPDNIAKLKSIFIDVTIPDHNVVFEDTDGIQIACRVLRNFCKDDTFIPRSVNWVYITSLLQAQFNKPLEEKKYLYNSCYKLYNGNQMIIAYCYAVTKPEFISLDAAKNHMVKTITGKLPHWFDFSHMPEYIQRLYEVYEVPVMSRDEYENYIQKL